jgi:hypothetical protein
VETLLVKLEIFLMNLESETEEQFKKCKPNSPIAHRRQGQLEMLEKIATHLEELKG